jgi:CMP-N,N'-diacetyllegionaminic acid synthase
VSYIAFIPARSGSKRIKDKNVRIVKKKPLIYFSINAAKKSKFIKDIFISTNSLEIKRISENYNCDINNLRPNYLSGDNVSMHQLLKKTLIIEKERFKKFKYLVLLQPTSPLRTFRDIDMACKKFEKYKNKADCLVSTFRTKKITEIKKTMIGDKNFITKFTKNKKFKKIDKLYHRNGPAILIVKIKNIKKFILDKKICNFVMSKKKSIDINYYRDLQNLRKII